MLLCIMIGGRYSRAMDQDGARPFSYLVLTAGLAFLAMLGGLGLALWHENGASLLISLTQNGLPICF